mmetsp:Transcript_33363/g.76875  ORF Transcript_33363/g.76875 Transcript_33363/m.76875 type:complete len:85 (-) Transcript_33363:217-471(-)
MGSDGTEIRVFIDTGKDTLVLFGFQPEKFENIETLVSTMASKALSRQGNIWELWVQVTRKAKEAKVERAGDLRDGDIVSLRPKW